MSLGSIIGLSIAGVLLLVILFVTIGTYNKVVKLKVRVDNAWSQIDVQLKKRFDLIPNLVETVKGYAKHEKETLENVTKARASVAGASTPEQAIEANNQLSGALSRLLMVAEKYPDLKANANFMGLQGELKDIEGKIAKTRQFYNDTTMFYNEYIMKFPSNIFARMFGFKQKSYFEAEAEAKVAPKVQF